MRWGLVPHWAKDIRIGYSTINARLETARTKPAFRAAWKHRRCLIPSSGYYEWKAHDANTKQPYFIHSLEAPVLFFGGLWEQWQSPEGGELLTYSILTRDADGPLREVHDRMPLMLSPAVLNDWLNGDADHAMAVACSAPLPELSFHAVGKAVGSPRNNAPHLIDAV